MRERQLQAPLRTKAAPATPSKPKVPETPAGTPPANLSSSPAPHGLPPKPLNPLGILGATRSSTPTVPQVEPPKEKEKEKLAEPVKEVPPPPPKPININDPQLESFLAVRTLCYFLAFLSLIFYFSLSATRNHYMAWSARCDSRRLPLPTEAV